MSKKARRSKRDRRTALGKYKGHSDQKGDRRTALGKYLGFEVQKRLGLRQYIMGAFTAASVI